MADTEANVESKQCTKLVQSICAPGFFAVMAALPLVLSLIVVKPVYAQVPDGPLTGVEEDVEDNVEEDVEDDLGEDIEQDIEEDVEEQVENDIEQNVDDNVEGEIQEDIEQRIEETIEDNLDSTVEEVVEAGVEETIEQNIIGGVEMTTEEFVEIFVEGRVEDAVEDNVEADVEGAVEDTIEQVVEAAVEDSVEQSVESSVEEVVESTVEEVVESVVASQVEEAVAQSVEDSVEDVVRSSVEASIEIAVENSVEEELEVGVEDELADRLENRIDRILDDIENELDVDESRIQKDQWLVMAEPEVFEELAAEGYLFDAITELPGLGLQLAEVAAPSSFDINKVRDGVMDIVGKDRAEVDLNHIYTAGIPKGLVHDKGIDPRSALAFPEDLDNLPVRIGMIDSQVDVDHPAFQASRIESRAFTPADAELPEFHGTAIASIIAADDQDYRGLAPKAELYAAAVFENDPERGEIASTVSLVRALDWLMSSGVDAVNISLAGPPNRLLEAALARAAKQEMLLLAAAGNGGPVAQPMFPAAYDSVVAVTAVDASGQVFRLANRGDYLDIAAPGVGLIHAQAGGGYTTSSGTSFAVPFAATAVAHLRQTQSAQATLALLFDGAEDVGPPGRDEIYGRGLLRPGAESGVRYSQR